MEKKCNWHGGNGRQSDNQWWIKRFINYEYEIKRSKKRIQFPMKESGYHRKCRNGIHKMKGVNMYDGSWLWREWMYIHQAFGGGWVLFFSSSLDSKSITYHWYPLLLQLVILDQVSFIQDYVFSLQTIPESLSQQLSGCITTRTPSLEPMKINPRIIDNGWGEQIVVSILGVTEYDHCEEDESLEEGVGIRCQKLMAQGSRGYKKWILEG
jgi:hypothetical protein